MRSRRSIPEYQMMSRIGDHFGVCGKRIGKWLFALGWRVYVQEDQDEDNDMEPSPEAKRSGLVMKLPDARNGYPVWMWHWKRTLALLEEEGHERIDK